MFGEATQRFDATKPIAAAAFMDVVAMRNAQTTVAERDMPTKQCTCNAIAGEVSGGSGRTIQTTYEDIISRVLRECRPDECGRFVQMPQDIRPHRVCDGYMQCFQMRQRLWEVGRVLNNGHHMRNAERS